MTELSEMRNAIRVSTNSFNKGRVYRCLPLKTKGETGYVFKCVKTPFKEDKSLGRLFWTDARWLSLSWNGPFSYRRATKFELLCLKIKMFFLGKRIED